MFRAMATAGVAALALGLAGGAQAAEAPAASAAPVSTAPDQTDQQIAAWLADGADPADAPAAGEEVAPDPGPRRVHGSASFTVGSQGLRAVSAAADIPIGQTGDLGVAVSDAHWGGRYGGDARSLAVSLRLGAPSGDPGPCGLHHSVPLPSDTAQQVRCGEMTGH